jgi:beta-galactosidase
MIPLSRFRGCLAFGSLLALTSGLLAASRQTLDFNPDWRFVKADAAGAQAAGFDDHGWERVSTPHTFNDIDTFDNWSTPGHRGEQIQWSGRTWYRKTFTAPEAWRGKDVFVEFEAARQVAEVYLNGEKLGVSKTGFTPFGFDLTAHLKIGASNVLAVMVDNRFMRDSMDAATAAEVARRNHLSAVDAPIVAQTRNLDQLSRDVNQQVPERVEDLQADQIPWNNPHWHPAHGGLYRNVRLIVTDPLHITLPLYSFLQTEGPYVYATDISPDSAKVTVEIPVANGRDTTQHAQVHATVVDADGRTALSLDTGLTVGVHGTATLRLSGAIAHPRLWEPAYPHVYRVKCWLEQNGHEIDAAEMPLGIRAVRWDVAHGFFINGNHLKLRGWGQKPNDEWPGLGSALPDWLHAYTLALMKDAGGNYVRWGHAAAGPAQIEAADALGIVTLQPGVDGESDTVGAAWKVRVEAFRDVLIYFRNDPSILIWEGGNQKVTREHVVELRGLMDKYDPYGGRAYTHRRGDKVDAEFMDVCEGTEGGHEIPWLPVIEGEYDREESPRRVWDDFSPPNFGYPEAKGMTYQLTSEQFAVNEISQYKKIAAPSHAGGANWVFTDTTSGGRVPAEVARASGEVDAVRLPKEAYYVSATLFRDDPQVHIVGHWTYPAGTKKPVYVASNADDVELFLNGKSLGHGSRSKTNLFTFPEVTFAPGELKAVATRAGQVVATDVRTTAGDPVALRLTPILPPGGWRADGHDVALVDVEAVDAKGERCPTVQPRVDFETSGPAVWRGGYNSGQLDSINHPWLDLECGVNRVALRAARTGGTVTLHAKAAGLRDATLKLELQPFMADDGLAPLAVPPAAVLPAKAPEHPAFLAANALIKTPRETKPGAAAIGRFIRNFNYTGPQLAIVHVEADARNGKNAYVDRDYAFADLPPELVGADWVQIADSDQTYSAVDLMEIAVRGHTTVTVAHDTRVAPPEWLLRQFQPTHRTLTLHGQTFALFERQAERDESLTLGTNYDGRPPEAEMYLVFVNGAHHAGPAGP